MGLGGGLAGRSILDLADLTSEPEATLYPGNRLRPTGDKLAVSGAAPAVTSRPPDLQLMVAIATL